MKVKRVRAARFYEKQENLKLEDVEAPEIGSTEALVRVKACGVCHSDLHFLSGLLKPGKSPIILGHEIAGDVAQVGDAVTKLKERDRVLLKVSSSCRECYYCRIGRENLCSNPLVLGFTVDGGYAEYVKAPARDLVKLPNNISYEEGAPLTCGGATAFHAVTAIAEPKLGDTVVINGFGGLGIYAMQIAKLRGARLMVVDVSEDKLELASKLGADAVINAKEKDVQAEVKRLTGGEGADVIIEFVGLSERMIKGLRKTGKLVSVGSSGQRFEVDPVHLIQNEIKVLGCIGYSRHEIIEVTELARARKIKTIIACTFPLTEINAVLAQLKRNEILGRAVVKP